MTAATAKKLTPVVDANKDGSHPNWQPVRDQLKHILENEQITKAQISRESSVNAGALTEFLKGTYVGRNDRLNERLQSWLDTYQRRVEAVEEFAQGPGFLYTPTAKKIEETLDYAHMAPDIAIIYGGAGTGKTCMFREYSRNHTGVCISTMTPSHATVNKAMREIGKCVGLRHMRDSASLFDALCDALSERRALLIIDEAQNLGNKALDQIRQIHDRINCGIVLAGNHHVYTNMSGRRAEYLDRLFSRVGMKLRLERANESDARMIAEAWGITDDICLKKLKEIAAKPGGLRGVDKTLKLAHMLSGDGKIESKYITAAWRRLSPDQV